VSPRAEGTAHRWPIALVLVAVLVAGIVAQRDRDDQPAARQTVPASALGPTARPAGALSSTWYCAGGTATGASSGVAEESVVVENATGRSVGGQLTVMTDQGQAVSRAIVVPAHDHLDVRISDIVKAAAVGVVVEMRGGGVAVSHMLVGPTGAATAACSTGPSPNWYVPAGTTRPGTTQQLALFNPFPTDATVEITFATDDGARAPQAYQGLVVPSGHVVLLDITGVVTLRNEIATTVVVREGRLVVDQIQTADGTNGTAKGLAVTPAAPTPTNDWWFADGGNTPGAQVRIVVQNPGQNDVPVRVALHLDQAAQNGTISPFTATAPGGGYTTVDVLSGRRVPVGVGFQIEVTAPGGSGIVAARLVNAAPPASPPGFSLTLGAPVLARTWLLPTGSLGNASSAVLVVANPSGTNASVSVALIVSGASSRAAGATTVAPNARGIYTIPIDKTHSSAIEVRSAAPVVVEARLTFPTGAGFTSPLGVPVAPAGD
jgi:hypothetical protein